MRTGESGRKREAIHFYQLFDFYKNVNVSLKYEYRNPIKLFTNVSRRELGLFYVT